MRYSHRRVAACLLGIASVTAFPLSGVALFPGSASASIARADDVAGIASGRPASFSAPQVLPQPAPAPEPVETTVPSPEPTRGASIAPEASASAATPTTPPSVNAELSECKRGEGALVKTSPQVFRQIGVEQAWSVTDGQGVVVAVVDSGVDETNPHLQGAVVPGTDLVGKGIGTKDEDGHGTAVAGLVAARPVDGSGVLGLAKGAMIMPVRVYTGTSEDHVKRGTGPQPARTAQGIRWAADSGAKVIVVGASQAQDAPVLKEAVEHATAMGALVVADTGVVDKNATASPSAGGAGATSTASDANGGGGETRYPAAYPQVLGVTALDANGGISNEVIQGSRIDIAVPAQSVPTTFFNEGDCVVSQGRPSPSFAAAYAAGAAALVVAAHPSETPADWKYRMTATAIRPQPGAPSTMAGWGLLAPYAALNFINDGTATGPENPQGSRPVATPSIGTLTPLSKDPAPARRARLTAATGIVGAVALAMGLVARKVRSR